MKIGIEIECPFSFYYPDLYEKYFKSGKKFHEYSSYELIGLNEELTIREPIILEKLKMVSDNNNLTRGQDRYWEFVFPPETDVYFHLLKIGNLILEDLLPLDIPLSVHFTISGIDINKAYAVLLFLELKYLTKSRVLEGFGNEYFMPAWGKKLCKCGILKKTKNLIDADYAYELRTLKIKMRDMKDVFDDLTKLLNDDNIINKAKTKVSELGLEWKPWNKEDFIKFAENLK